jgi:hypothetical protein
LTPSTASAPELSSLKLNSNPGLAVISSLPSALKAALSPSIASSASAMPWALVSSSKPWEARVGHAVEVHIDAHALAGAGGGVADIDEEPAVARREGELAEGLVQPAVHRDREVALGDRERAGGLGQPAEVGPGAVELVDLEDQARGERVDPVERRVDAPVPGLEQAADRSGGDLERRPVAAQGHDRGQGRAVALAFERDAPVGRAEHDGDGPDEDIDRPALLLDDADVHERRELVEGVAPPVAELVGGRAARLRGDDLLVEGRDLAHQRVGAEDARVELALDLRPHQGDIAPHVADELGELVGLLHHHRLRADEVGRLAPGVEQGAHLSRQVVAAQLAHHRLELAHDLVDRGRGGLVGEPAPQAGLQRLVDLPLHRVDAHAPAQRERAHHLPAVGREEHRLARVPRGRGVGHVVAGDLDAHLARHQGAPADLHRGE